MKLIPCWESVVFLDWYVSDVPDISELDEAKACSVPMLLVEFNVVVRVNILLGVVVVPMR